MALLEAFDGPGLERLARRLQIELAHIAQGSQRKIVTDFLDEVGRQGRGRALVRTARLANPTHPGLNEVLARLIHRKFKGEQVAGLVRILEESRLGWEFFERQLLPCVPDTLDWNELLVDEFQEEPERLAGLMDVLSEFSERNAEGRPCPLFEFVLRLRNCPEASGVAEPLRGWLRRTALALGMNPEAIEAQGYRLLGELYLLVKIERVSVEGFQVEAWLADNQTPLPRAIFKEEQSRKLGELPEVLKRILNHREVVAPLKVLGSSKLTIEFLLPWELLFHPLAVESWEVSKDVPIGTRYQVVVRSLDRAYAEVRPPLDAELEPSALVPWNEKWRMLSGSPSCAPRSVWVSQPVDHQGRRFLAELDEPEVVCLALTMLPPDRSEPTLRELIHRCLVHGVPIALWVREPRCVGAEVRTLFKSLLEELQRLPSGVLEARREGFRSEDEGHLGNHITLLWDDPNRLPADARPGWDYSAPGAAGVKG